MKSAHISPIITQTAFVLPLGIVGITDASAARSPLRKSKTDGAVADSGPADQ